MNQIRSQIETTTSDFDREKLQAVSYTHLDVYKRQRLNRRAWLYFEPGSPVGFIRLRDLFDFPKMQNRKTAVFP